MDFDAFYRIFMPYAIKKLGDGKYTLVNREYAPLGCWPEKFGDAKKEGESFYLCGDFPDLVEYENDFGFFLYNDGTKPSLSLRNMEAYLSKIDSLMNMWVHPNRPFDESLKEEYLRINLERLQKRLLESNPELERWKVEMEYIFVGEKISIFRKYMAASYQDFKLENEVFDRSEIYFNEDEEDPQYVMVNFNGDDIVTDISVVIKK